MPGCAETTVNNYVFIKFNFFSLSAILGVPRKTLKVGDSPQSRGKLLQSGKTLKVGENSQGRGKLLKLGKTLKVGENS